LGVHRSTFADPGRPPRHCENVSFFCHDPSQRPTPASTMLSTQSMRPAPLAPSLHLFVCSNRRPADSALGAGCGEAGEAVFRTLKGEVAKRGAYRAIWVTQTHCLGICPKRGCTVAVYARQHSQRIVSEVEPADAAVLFGQALSAAGSGEAGAGS
jgi:predicted metal-binding protein